MIDILAAVIRYLKADADISYQTGGRVYGVEIPAAEIADMPRKCLLIRDAGGREAADFVPHAAPRYDFFSYGATPYEAAEVDRAVWEALHNLSREETDEVLLHSAAISGGRLPWKEPHTGWPGFVRSAVVQAGTDGVS